MEEGLDRVIEAARRVGLTWDGSINKFRDASGAVRGLNEVKARLEELERNAQKAAQTMETLKGALASGFQNVLQGIPQGIGQALGSQLLAPFQALKEVVGGSGRVFVDLDEALRQTLAAAGAGNGKFDELAQSVVGLASGSAFSSKELAGVTTELARAGFSLDGLTKALPGIQAAAAASGEGLAETTQNMITALGGFQLGTDQAGRVADVMTVAANAAAQSTSDVGEAFKYVAPVAKSLGITLEDTAAATILLANAGIKGSQAGTALRTGLGRLAQTAAAGSSDFAELSRGTGRMGEVAQRLALSLSDVQGNLLPLPQLLGALKRGTDGLASTDKALVLKLLFGDEAGSSWVSLLNNSTAAIDKAFASTANASGTAAKVAAQNLSGISGALKLLEGAIGGFRHQSAVWWGPACCPSCGQPRTW
jgi:TP901 family phage tail tape measure protein